MEGSLNTFQSAANTNVSNFVSVKLSGKHNYHLWKAQMLCLLDSNNMCGMVDDTFVAPRYLGMETMRQYDSLVKGWIFGSVSEDVLLGVYNLGSAKNVWENLKSNYDLTMDLQEDAKTVKEEIEVVSAKSNIVDKGASSIEIIVPTETQTENEDTKKKSEKKIKRKQKLRAAVIKGNWPKVESILKKDEGLATEALYKDGSTVLHTAVRTGQNDIVKNFLQYIKTKEEHVLTRRNSDGGTALHIAAIVGNKHAAELLVNEKSELLRTKDNHNKEPLQKAYEHMHLDTIGYLLKAVNDDGKSSQSSLAGSVHPDDEIGVDFLVNAISAKRYSLALELVQKFPHFASERDDVLMALAKTFPSGLHHWQKLIYPSVRKLAQWMVAIAAAFVYCLFRLFQELYHFIIKGGKKLGDYIAIFLKVVFLSVVSATAFISLLILITYFPFLLLYSLWWKGAKTIGFAPIKHIENKMKEWGEAKEVLELVCEQIDKLDYTGTHHPHYTRPILEATCQNAYEVVDEILYRSPEAIQSTDTNGYDIIQLAIIHRSENIYNLIYATGERKNLYRTIEDSSKNNIVHLAGKLAPSSVLNRRTGAALQLQCELRWREEVKKHVFPTYITKENIFKETPDMVFTREHNNLLKEGEQWMKTTAESCSITAALITTIVFAAAITVPGGSNQEKGTPLFEKKSAFIVFAISNAISLFASITAVLVFLSILTTRFAEKDFLVSLPMRLFIGLFFLLLSTTSMMVAFSATLFLVHFDEKVWMLAPICGLAFIPIAFFVALQFPLMVELFRWTYLPIFGKQ